MTPGDVLAGALAAGLAGAPGGSLAASRFGIQRVNGERSATSVMYQSFLAPSQRAPSAFAASLSAKGVTRLIRLKEKHYRRREMSLVQGTTCQTSASISAKITWRFSLSLETSPKPWQTPTILLNMSVAG